MNKPFTAVFARKVCADIAYNIRGSGRDLGAICVHMGKKRFTTRRS